MIAFTERTRKDGRAVESQADLAYSLNNPGLGGRTQENRVLIPDTAHALTGEGHDASEDGTGRGTPIVAFDTTQITSKLNYSNPQPGDPCHPLASGAHPPAIAFDTYNQSVGDVAHTLRVSTDHGIQSTPHVVTSAVRRLTPLECERLQGFPDGHTCLCQPLEAYAEDPDAAALACTCPDSPRYRALGNAVTVNVIEWLGRRILGVIG